jgi:hypothetical protein
LVRPIAEDFSAANGRLRVQRGLLERELSLVRDARHLPQQYQEAEAALLHEAPRLFAGTDALAASAALAGFVSEYAYRSRVFLQGSETKNPSQAGDGVLRLAVEVRAVGDLAGLTTWLDNLERGSKLVRVTRLSVTPAERLNGAERSDEQVLGVVLTAEAFMLAPQ